MTTQEVTIECVTTKVDKKISFKEDNTVKYLKDMISLEEEFGKPLINDQRLSFNGITLQDEWKLRFSWLGGKTVHLAVTSDTAKQEKINEEISKTRREIETLKKEIKACDQRTALLKWRSVIGPSYNLDTISSSSPII